VGEWLVTGVLYMCWGRSCWHCIRCGCGDWIVCQVMLEFKVRAKIICNRCVLYMCWGRCCWHCIRCGRGDWIVCQIMLEFKVKAKIICGMLTIW